MGWWEVGYLDAFVACSFFLCDFRFLLLRLEVLALSFFEFFVLHCNLFVSRVVFELVDEVGWGGVEEGTHAFMPELLISAPCFMCLVQLCLDFDKFLLVLLGPCWGVC